MAYSLGSVKPWVSSAANELGPRFGIKTIGGYRAGQFIYGSRDHPGGLALDLMTYQGGPLADYARANADRLGVTYVIWNRRIWSRARNAEGWRPYSGDSPHTDHVHVSFQSTPPAGGPAPAAGAGGGIVSVRDEDSSLTGAVAAAAGALKNIAGGVTAVGELARKAMWLALPSTQVRLASGVLGAGLVAVGVVLLVREVRSGG